MVVNISRYFNFANIQQQQQDEKIGFKNGLTENKMITKEQIENNQQEWANAVIKVGSLKNNRQECETFTQSAIGKLYAYHAGTVLFKPTKTSVIQFRSTKQGAVSYMIGGDINFPEDHGFALKPWLKIRFENTGMILEENRALAMGNYFFTDESGNETKVEFTFGYRKIGDDLKIDLHHSSIPFNPAE